MSWIMMDVIKWAWHIVHCVSWLFFFHLQISSQGGCRRRSCICGLWLRALGEQHPGVRSLGQSQVCNSTCNRWVDEVFWIGGRNVIMINSCGSDADIFDIWKSLKLQYQPSKHGQDPWRLILGQTKTDLAQNMTWFEPGRRKRTSWWRTFDFWRHDHPHMRWDLA